MKIFKEFLWQCIAKVISHPVVVMWLIDRAQKTPYQHLPQYMDRWWVFNGYGSEETKYERKIKWLPSIRIHHILRADLDRNLHDHPWDARTIILKGYYEEERLMPDGTTRIFYRFEGNTARLNYGEYHTIKDVSEGGVWTLFFTWKYKGSWGFLVDGVKIPWREYEARNAA